MTETQSFDAAFRDDLARLFAWRRDVRRFLPLALPDDLVDELIAATACAPSVGYSQPARFVRVDDPARRAAIVENFERSNAAAAGRYAGERAQTYAGLKLAGLREAPLHLAVFTDGGVTRGHGLGAQSMPETLAYSTVLAIHTLWLAARARGIGVGWVSILDPRAAAATLAVPEAWSLTAYLCVGYPQEEHADRELVRAKWEDDDPAARTLYRR